MSSAAQQHLCSTACVACQEEQVPDDHWTLMVAVAMQETKHMDVEERDRQKDDRNHDGVYDSDANASIFNLSKVRSPGHTLAGLCAAVGFYTA